MRRLTVIKGHVYTLHRSECDPEKAAGQDGPTCGIGHSAPRRAHIEGKQADASAVRWVRVPGIANAA